MTYKKVTGNKEDQSNILSRTFIFLSLLFVSCPVLAQSSLRQSSVSFHTSDKQLQRLYDSAEAKAKWNLQTFGKYRVLVEGAGYQNVWLETQPMGGYMYAKRNLEVAKNNFMIFLDHQREDGRLPGMLSLQKGVLTPHYGWFQGFYFPQAAFDLYFLLGKDTAYLKRLYVALERFDAYLWKTRDSDGDGCLEAWCTWDLGEDNAVRFAGAPDSWPFDFPPSRSIIAEMTDAEMKQLYQQHTYDSSVLLPVPIESMDFMSFSFSCRKILASISEELQTGKVDYWRKRAAEVSARIKSYLWDESKKACYDRDPLNSSVPILLHNNLRCMYFNSFDQQMADAFIKYHLMNEDEFWTKMPLPSVAANDPAFRNAPGNNWSGQPQGLTYQRAISALENYGHYAEVTLLGEKLIAATKVPLRFTQQFDPFTGEINKTSDGYGPTILSVLEYISRMYGVYRNKETISWSALKTNSGDSNRYEQVIGTQTYKLHHENDQVRAYINNKLIFTCSPGARVVTDLNGNFNELIGISPKRQKISLSFQNNKDATLVEPNATYKFDRRGKLVLHSKVAFDYNDADRTDN